MKRWLPIAAALLAVAVLLGAMQLLNQTPQKPMEMATKAPATPAPMRVLIDKQEVVPERVIIAYNGETTGYVINKQTGTYAAENYDAGRPLMKLRANCPSMAWMSPFALWTWNFRMASGMRSVWEGAVRLETAIMA